MNVEEKTKLLSLFLSILLIISVISIAVVVSGETEKEIVMVSLESEDDLSILESLGVEILETYPQRALVKIEDEQRDGLQEAGISIYEIPRRTVLNVKQHQFDINEGYPDFPDELMIEGYDPGTPGVHLVHMLGPVHPEWRNTLEDMGAEIVNYVPNYAYEVRMTPELAQEVEDLYFVDWVGIYQPGFKLDVDLTPGVVSVNLLPETDSTTLSKINALTTVLSYNERPFGSTMLLYVDNMHTFVELANLNDVYFMTNYVEPELQDEMATQIIGGGLWIFDDDDDPYTPYRAHGAFGSHVNQLLGLSGTGVVIAIADTGIGDGEIGDAGHQDFTGRVIGGHGWGDDPGYWADGHGHGTHCTGSAAGDTYSGTREVMDFAPYYKAQGLAHGSDIWAEKIFSDAGVFLPGTQYYEIVQIPKQMADAYVHSNSWGAAVGGQYTTSSSEFDMAVRDADNETEGNQPMVITTSAGNAGPLNNTIGSPATAKNVISVGATENFNPEAGVINPDVIVGFSSRGWTDDNRVKPDVVAPGLGIVSTYIGDGDPYATMGGTSMSNPAVAGAAALVVEWYEGLYGVRPSPAMVKAMLVNTAYDMDDETGNTGPIPNRDEGWGMVNLPALMDAPTDFMFVDETELIGTGEHHEYQISWEDDLEDLKISLVWTDKYASGGDLWTLKNNLDLEVIAPDGGTYYRGNAFPVDAEGYSSSSYTSPNTTAMPDFDTNEDGWDDVNNVLNVYIPAHELEIGEYTVRVIGTNVPEDGNNDGDANQDYALFMSNAIDPEGLPLIELTYPEGGEDWEYDEWKEITWETTEGDNPIDLIDLFYSADDGESWEEIALGLPDTGSYTWLVPDLPSNRARIRAVVNDDGGLTRLHTSGIFDVIGTPPGSPENLGVEHHLGPTTEIVDDFRDGDYTSKPEWTVYDGDWFVEEEDYNYWLEGEGSISTPYTQAYGRWEWDFQFVRTDIVGGMFQVMRYYFIQDTADPGDGSFSGYYIIVTGELTEQFGYTPQINLWRFDDGQQAPEGTLISATWDANTEWNTLAVDRDEDGVFSIYLNDDLVGISQEDNTYTTSEYIGLRNEATSPDDLHRVSEIRTTAEREGDDHNLLTWGRSPDDGIGRNSVDHYDIQRSLTETGEWSSVGTVPADGSESYSFRDLYAGAYDDIYWWYRVRAVDFHEQMDEDPMPPVQEPIPAEISVEITSPAEGDIFTRDSVTVHWKSSGVIEYYNLYLNTEDPIYKLERNHNFINLPNGHHTITVEAVGDTTVSDTVSFIADTTPPYLEITSESGGMTFEEEFLIEGITDLDATIEIDGTPVDVNETTGEFSYQTTLIDGLNLFEVVAENEVGNTAEETVYALYMPDIPELWAEIDTIWDEIDDIRIVVQDLQGQIDELQADLDAAIADLQGQIDGLEADLNAAETQIANLQADLAVLEEDLEELQDDFGVLEEEIDDLWTSLSEAETDITALRNSLSEAQDNITSLETSLGAAQSDINALESDLEEHRTAQEALDADQDDEISSAANMAIVGIILGILALIIAIFAVAKKNSGGTVTETYEDDFEDETTESDEEFIDDDEIF